MLNYFKFAKKVVTGVTGGSGQAKEAESFWLTKWPLKTIT
jgi:hypothetical protein